MTYLRYIAVAFLITFFSIPSFSSVDHERWEALINKAVTQGTSQESEMGEFRTLTISNTTDLSGPHLIEYFSAVGGQSVSDGKFYVGHLELVWENWSVNEDNNWDIDQWLFIINKDTTLSASWHNHLIETRSGGVLLDERIKETDATTAKSFDQKLGDFL